MGLRVFLASATPVVMWLLPGASATSVIQGGPIRQVPAHRSFMVYRAGEALTDAQEVLELRGRKPATIRSIEVIG